MQFAVPQFTEVEDRLIARLTLRQFLVLLGVGGVILFFWSIFGPSFIFFLIAVPIGIAGIGAALGRFNGRPMFTYVVPFAAFATSNRVMVFKRETVDAHIAKSENNVATKTDENQTPQIVEPTESRLKNLAYLLDKKTAEEGEIISHDFEKIIATPQRTSTEKIKKISTVNTLSRPVSPPAERHHVVPAKTAPQAPTPSRFDPNKIFNPNG